MKQKYGIRQHIISFQIARGNRLIFLNQGHGPQSQLLPSCKPQYLHHIHTGAVTLFMLTQLQQHRSRLPHITINNETYRLFITVSFCIVILFILKHEHSITAYMRLFSCEQSSLLSVSSMPASFPAVHCIHLFLSYFLCKEHVSVTLELCVHCIIGNSDST